jgi:uncharacterized protein YneF (UPF0154 family)
MGYVIGILITLLCVAIFIITNLFIKLEILEDAMADNDTIINSVYTSIQNAYARMKSIDRIGSFEADDETGFIFDEIKSVLEQLNDEYSLDEDTQETE